MINLNETPRALYEVDDGDVVQLDGIDMIVSESKDDRIYLTTADSPGLTDTDLIYNDEVPYKDKWKHVRVDGGAVMTPRTMVDAIINKQYVIG